MDLYVESVKRKLFVYPDSSVDPTGFIAILEDKMLKNGWDKQSNIEEADDFLVLEHPRLRTPEMTYLRNTKARKILLRFEPKVVNPHLYQRRTEKLYDIILNVGSVNFVHGKIFVIRWPYSRNDNPATPNLHKPIDIVKEVTKSLSDLKVRRKITTSIVASNKVAWAGKSNYRLRRQIILSSGNQGIMPFGGGWGMSRVQRLITNLRIYAFFLSQGHFANPFRILDNFFFSPRKKISAPIKKSDITEKSDFQLVIENSDTYVTEKLLDCMISGAIPVYKGPELSAFRVPSSCYVKFPNNPTHLRSIIASFDEYVISNLRTNIFQFLTSAEGYSRWKPENVAKDILTVLK